MENTQLRRDCYSLLKALIVPLVVLGHFCVMYTQNGAFRPLVTSRTLGLVSTYIYSFHMPAFFMLSGCVYGFAILAGKYRAPGHFLLKKTKRLILPYFLFGLLLVVPVVYFCKVEPLSIPQAAHRNIILATQPRHLWYVLTLFEIFVLCALLRPLLAKTPLIVFLGAAAVYYFVQPKLRLTDAYLPAPNFLGYKNLLRNLVYFVFGVLLNKHFDSILRVVKKVWFLWIVFPIAQAAIFCPATGIFYKSYIQAPLFGLLGGFAVLSFGMIVCSYLPKLASRQFFRSLSECGYGIYLLHPMLIYCLYYFLREKAVDPYLLVGAGTVIITALCWGLTLAYRKLFKKSRKPENNK